VDPIPQLRESEEREDWNKYRGEGRKKGGKGEDE
jgi:hypothetical protein